jgi:adenylate cyclase
MRGSLAALIFYCAFSRFGRFRLEAMSRRLWLGDRPLKLTAKTFEILLFLVQRHGQVVEREELLRNVWRDSFVEDGNLTVHIAALRKLLGDAQRDPQFIATIARRGYCFVARVTEINDAEAIEPTRIETEHRGGPRQLASLAVLPLRAVGHNEELEYLADGITENLINSLSQLPQLKVLAASAVFGYKDKSQDPCAAGKGLGVATVLTGEVRLINEELLISVELVNVEDGRQLWGTQYHEPMTDIFELQQTIALAITEKLLPKLTAEEKSLLENRQTKSPEAYRSYLKGRRFLSQLTTESIRKSLLVLSKPLNSIPIMHSRTLGSD